MLENFPMMNLHLNPEVESRAMEAQFGVNGRTGTMWAHVNVL